jgi:hypothetical protein
MVKADYKCERIQTNSRESPTERDFYSGQINSAAHSGGAHENYQCRAETENGDGAISARHQEITHPA